MRLRAGRRLLVFRNGLARKVSEALPRRSQEGQSRLEGVPDAFLHSLFAQPRPKFVAGERVDYVSDVDLEGLRWQKKEGEGFPGSSCQL